MQITKIPTGLASLDPMIDDGYPSGSFVLLLGKVGAGNTEFAYTSAAMLSVLKSNIHKMKEGIVLPEKICYISFTRSKEDVQRELSQSFSPDYYSALEQRLEFSDFSEMFFRHSPVPASWTTQEMASLTCLKGIGEKKGILEALVTYLDKNAMNSVVIMDSLTALVRLCVDIKWDELVLFLRGIQRVSKKWNGVVYALLTKDILGKGKEEEIADCMDGVLVFSWEEMGSTMRQRVLYIKKFRSLLPRIEKENIMKFRTWITSRSGFEVSHIKHIAGR